MQRAKGVALHAIPMSNGLLFGLLSIAYGVCLLDSDQGFLDISRKNAQEGFAATLASMHLQTAQIHFFQMLGAHRLGGHFPKNGSLLSR